MPSLRIHSNRVLSIACFAFLLGAFGSTSLAGTFTAFGPKNYTRGSGAAVTVTDTFTVLNPATQYTLKAFNGGMQDDQTELVAWTNVTLNGVLIVGPTNFNQGVAEVDVPVTLQASNTLTVEVRGKPGGLMTIQIIGVDNDPPKISATPNPAPNAAGWNKTSVTVSFTCSDATSGVASCPPSKTVTTEGANQSVSGTATDNAGNTASTSITLNIDETAPATTSSASPTPNAAGWNNSDVVVSFACNDALSGIATCPTQLSVTTEGANQAISGTAFDVAGNSASATQSVSLDKTPPAISITSPVNGATLTASSVSVTGNVSDSLSGLSTVTCNGIPATIQSGTFTCSVNLSQGLNSISAQAFDVAGNPSSASVSVTVSSGPNITSLSPGSGAIGSAVAIGGAGFGSTQGASTVTFNGAVAAPSSWSDTSITAAVPSGAATGPIVVTVGGASSNPANFTVTTPPSISFVNPTTTAAGAQITISGSAFGATQGSGSIVLGNTSGTVVTWSNTQIVATIAPNAQSGVVQVFQNGLASNQVPLNIVLPDTITASAFPAPNANGWNNSNVTVSFSCTSSGTMIPDCLASQLVTTEGANQVITGTIPGSGGPLSASVTLNIDKTPPALVISSPADGSTNSATPIVITGTVSDALSGFTSLTCNGVDAGAAGGSFSCNISLNVGVNLVVVRATDVAGNVAPANFHLSLAGALPPPNSLQVSPVMVNMLVGDTQQFTAVDDQGRPRSDATWTLSDNTLANISSDSSPILTANAVGQVTLTASIGSVLGQAQINILGGGLTTLPPGTVRWSAPSTPGFAVQQIVQAVPSSDGPDLYSVEVDSNATPLVRALTADGQQKWVAQLAPMGYNYSAGGAPNTAIPDGHGGILIKVITSTSPTGLPQMQTLDLDAQTGAQLWAFAPAAPIGFQFDPTPLSREIAIRGDGTVMELEGQTIRGFDGSSGAQVFSYSAPAGSLTVSPCSSSCGPFPERSTTLSPLTVGPDGTVYAVVGKIDAVVSSLFFNFTVNGLTSITETLSLLQIAPDGSSSLTPLRQDTSPQIPPPNFSFLGFFFLSPEIQGHVAFLEVGNFSPIAGGSAHHVIPDGQGGVLVPYSFTMENQSAPNPYERRVMHMVGGSVRYDSELPFPRIFNAPDFPIALGENGLAFATDLTSTIAFSTFGGQVSWTHPGTLIEAFNGGGASISDSSGNVVQIDSQGNAGAPSCSTCVQPMGLRLWITDSGPAGVVAGPREIMAASAYPTPQGNRESQNAAPKLSVATFMPSIPALQGRFGTEKSATDDIQNSIPKLKADSRFYGFLKDPSTVPAFLTENSNRSARVVGFIGHARFATDLRTNQREAVGLEFTDRDLIRTPDCSSNGNLLDVCFFLDNRVKPDGTSATIPPCLPGIFLDPVSGLNEVAVDILSYDLTTEGCYALPVRLGGAVAQTQKTLQTSADVVFIAACDTSTIFTGWWDMKLAEVMGGQALVLPDLAQMAALPKNQGLSSGAIDLQQSAVGWEALINSLADNKSVEEAVNSANDAISAFYGSITSWPNNQPLAQVIYKVVGDPSFRLR